MGYGFSAQNASGEIQIDQDFYCPRLFKEGSKTFSVTGGESRTISFTGRDNAPLIAVSPHTGQNIWVGLGQVTTNASSKYNGVILAANKNPGDMTIDYALYDAQGGIASNTNYGMQVFNSSGGVVFDSREAYLSVVDIVDVPKPAIGTVITTQHSHATLANAFYVINSLGGIVITSNGAGGEFLWTRGVKQTTNSEVEIKHIVIDNRAGGDQGFDTRVASKLLVCEKISI